jgi:hypothetical protein
MPLPAVMGQAVTSPRTIREAPLAEDSAGTDQSDDDAQRVLAEQLRSLRAERASLERQVAQTDILQRAITLVERDASALSSPRVQALRDRAQHLYDQLVQCWGDADGIRVRDGRVRSRAPHIPADTALAEVLAAESAERTRFRSTLEEAGVELDVPQPAGEHYGQG